MTESAGTGALPSPLSHFITQLDGLRAGGAPDMDAIGRLLMELAADDEFFAPLIAGMPPASMGVHWLVKPERGLAWCLSTGLRASWPTPIPTGAGSGSPPSGERRLTSVGM